MKFKIVIGILFINLFLLQEISNAQWLDPEWKKSIVLIEVQNDTASFRAVGTGFIVKYKQKNFIVTNKHIAKKKDLFIRFNLKSKYKSSFRCSIDTLIFYSKLPWGKAKSRDIAVLPLYVYPGIEIYNDSLDIKSIGISLLKDWDYINEGDDVYILGFPLRIGTGEHYSPVIRSGIIALKERKGEFLIDSNIFPGNSGGPVFLKSYIFDYRAKSLGKGTIGYLIGIVSNYISYTDVAISAQTLRPRITFEENSGLATVFSAEQIIKLLKNYVETHKL